MKPFVILSAFCILGFFTRFKPAEPFLTPYLVDIKGFTLEQVNNEIYPIWTYSYLSFLMFVGPVTEMIGYKPMIILQVASHVVTYAVLVWGTSLGMMQFMQVTYGLATAAEVSFFSYIYHLVPQDEYQKVTGFTRGSTLTGHVVSGILGQILILQAVEYLTLFQVSLAACILALFISFFMPRANKARKYDTVEEEDGAMQGARIATSERLRFRKVTGSQVQEWIKTTKENLSGSYPSWRAVRWSLWWGLCFCGVLSFEGYASSIWYDIDPNTTFNGFCDSLARFLGVVGTILPNIINAEFLSTWGETILMVGNVICALLSFLMAITDNIYVAYAASISFCFIIYFLIAVAAAQIALGILNTKYALVFGINTFLGLVAQTIIQVICSSPSLGISITDRFLIYGGYFVVVAALMLVSVIYQLTCHIVRKRTNQYALAPTNSTAAVGGRNVEEGDDDEDNDA